ncbi:hypothetical protein AAVH_32104, partial [Aphelenchoides avenae]
SDYNVAIATEVVFIRKTKFVSCLESALCVPPKNLAYILNSRRHSSVISVAPA